ncbi:MAG: hypothetical protein ISS74_10160 [Planctomycetes bacterium]|nr:hypothetical protein [Planctomycetota bacterium]
MSRKRQILIAMALGTLGILGLIAVATGQPRDLDAARKQYEIRLKQLAPDADADAHIALAKWCLREGLDPEAKSHALAAHKANPEDVRAKYLIYALSAAAPATGTGAGTGTELDTLPEAVMNLGEKKPVTITNEEARALTNEEGVEAIRGFREVQRILASRCGDIKCHGGIGSGAKWLLALQGTTTDRMLAENFRTVSRYFNRDNPEKSPLLTIPMKGEGSNHPEQIIRGKTDPVYSTLFTYIGKLLKVTQKDDFWGSGKAPSTPPQP